MPFVAYSTKAANFRSGYLTLWVAASDKLD